MKTSISLIAILIVLASPLINLNASPRPGFGELYYQGRVVRTVVPPATMKKPGTDDLYAVMNGAVGQRAVIAVAPGNPNYRGGKWAFHSVTWNVAPYLLKSEMEVMLALSLGHVTVIRVPENDFKCPVQP